MAFCGGGDMVGMKDYTWKKSRHTLLKGRWGIAIVSDHCIEEH